MARCDILPAVVAAIVVSADRAAALRLHRSTLPAHAAERFTP
jgi:hypothetical protein